jgi:hypothetical protein
MDRVRSADETDFNLRRLVRDVLATSDLADPHALAGEVLGRIKDCDLRPALGQVLASMVREEIRSHRNGGLPPLGPTSSGPGPRPHSPAAPRLTLHTQPEVMAESPGGVPRPIVKSGPSEGRRSARSAKVAAIRASGPKWLEERYNVGADPREWKRLGDCGFAELMFAAGQRRDQAARTSAAAERLESLAELLRVHGVERVRDLPAPVLASAGGAAA